LSPSRLCQGTLCKQVFQHIPQKKTTIRAILGFIRG
jgi:hypothetical protein